MSNIIFFHTYLTIPTTNTISVSLLKLGIRRNEFSRVILCDNSPSLYLME